MHNITQAYVHYRPIVHTKEQEGISSFLTSFTQSYDHVPQTINDYSFKTIRLLPIQ